MSLNLREFRPLPGLPAYLVHRDGHVATLKKERPALLAERRPESERPTFITVRIGRTDVRVRDLVLAMYGDVGAFMDRVS